MKKDKRDLIAESIADYDAMKPEEQGKLLVQVLEDQPILMGYLTNLADDFSDSEHEALVESTLILINAFVAAGIPVSMVPHQIVEEVIKEKVDAYEQRDQQNALDAESMKAISDSPKVFEDLRNRAFFKAEIPVENVQGLYNFNVVLDTVISMVERSAAAEMENGPQE